MSFLVLVSIAFTITSAGIAVVPVAYFEVLTVTIPIPLTRTFGITIKTPGISMCVPNAEPHMWPYSPTPIPYIRLRVDMIGGTLGDIDPLKRVPVYESQQRVQKGSLLRVPLIRGSIP